MKNPKALRFVLCTVPFVLVWCTPAYAGTSSSGKWDFQIAPYVWLAGLEGKTATLPGFPPADIDVDFFDDVLGNINGALMLVGEARKGCFGIVMDVAYTDIEFEESTPGPFFSFIKSSTKTWIVSAAGLYRLVEQERAFLDAIGGIRYWSVDSELSLGAGLLRPRKVSNKEDWVDPIIGLKGLTPIGESKFFVSGAFALGGFTVGSDLMWDVWANLGYQWTKGFSTTLGYRYLDVDYEKDGFLYDVAVPFLDCPGDGKAVLKKGGIK
ncbi:MAG: hypothetical protein JRI70_08310 [Deltaproteobacteria bacterium]|nr:hypothetical protein [Deltaproteobacteria bacterium]